MVLTATEPTELISTDGPPRYAPLVGDELLYVTNTESDVVREVELAGAVRAARRPLVHGHSPGRAVVVRARRPAARELPGVPPGSPKGHLRVYVGGGFTTAGTTTVNNIAKYTPATSTWSALNTGTPGVNSIVYALAVMGTDLYVGGNFTTAGTTTVNRIAKYTPSTSAWSALGIDTPGVNLFVFALAVMGTDLYVSGGFTTAGTTVVNNIAKYTPATDTWSA